MRSDRDIIEEILRISRRRSYQSFEYKNALLNPINKKAVTYDESTRTIKVWLSEHSPYEIGLEQLSSGSELMDFVFQINRKRICQPEHIKAFLDCVEELTDRFFQKNAQGIFCPSGINKKVDWPQD